MRAQPIHRTSARYRPRLLWLDERDLPSGSFGPEFLVNTFVGNTQATFLETRQSVASDAAGNFVATWTSKHQDGGAEGVFAQRFNAEGIPQGTEFQVNTTTQGNQQYSAVAMSANGAFVITWSSQGQDGVGTWGVYGQRFDAAGNPMGGEFLVNTTTAGNQQESSVAMDAVGRFVITWSSHSQDDSGSWGIYGQRYDFMGNAVGGEFQVNVTTARNQTHSTVATDLFGNLVVTWESENQDGDGAGVFARRFDAAGNAIGSEFQVNTIAAGNQEQPHVAVHPAGGFVVTWASDADNSGSFEILARCYDSNGIPQGAEFQVNTDSSDDRYPTAAIAANGDILVTWTRQQNADRNIVARRFTSAGVPASNEFMVNSTTANDQVFSSVAPTAAGDFVMIWSGAGTGDGAGVFGRIIASGGIVVSPTAGLVTTEAGGTASFSIVLISQPTGPVSIGLASTNPAEGVVSQSGVLFTPLNWDVPQIVTVTGVNDFAADGAVNYGIITAAASSTDLVYNNWDPADVSLSNADNDGPGIIVSPVSGLITSETGGAASFTVALATAPSANVTIVVSSSNLSEASLSAAALTFTPGNWSVAQTVNVSGVDDAVDDGDSAFTILTAPTISADANYAGIDAADIAGTNLDDDEASVLVTAATGMSTTEMGASTNFTIVLNSQPIADVTIALSSDAADEGTVFPANITFTPANWNVARTITVSGVDDFVVDGDFPYQACIGAAVSLDPSYDGLDASDVPLSNVDNDEVAILVTASPQLTTTEEGGADSFTVVLGSQPTANVVIGISSSDSAEALSSSVSLTFTPGNWNVAQQVTMTGIDDAVDDGNMVCNVSLVATSVDPLYDLFALGNLAVMNVDNDSAGLAVTALGDCVIKQVGGTADFCLRLETQPTSDVAVTLAIAGGGDVALSQRTVTFTTFNWNVPQDFSVTVWNAPPEVARWDITLIASSADSAYQALSPVAVSAYNGMAAPETETTPEPSSESLPPESQSLSPPVVLLTTIDPVLLSANTNPVELEVNQEHRQPEQPVSTPNETKRSALQADGSSAAEIPPAPSEPAVDAPAAPMPSVPLPPSIPQAPAAAPAPVVPSPAAPPLNPSVVRAPVFNPALALELLATVHYETASWPKLVNSVFSVGLVASAGYVLLSTKASYWLLTAFAARPLWKQFDPMEVLFAWEEEQERRRARGQDGSAEDESLQSMVDR